jgi:hypothetical protein
MHDDVRTRRLKGLRPMVGDTPLLSVRLRYRGRECRVHGLWGNNVFDDGRCKRGVGMLDLSYKLKFTEL